jgi:hypothetical protein
VVSFTPQPLNPWYPLNGRLGGPQSWSGWLWEEKILGPTGTHTPTPHQSSLVTLKSSAINWNQSHSLKYQIFQNLI